MYTHAVGNQPPAPRRLTPAEQGRLAREALERRLDPARPLLDRVASALAAGFRGVALEKSAELRFDRRPLISLRLPVEGEPPAHLTISPGWVGGDSKQFVPEVVTFELVAERVKLGGRVLPNRDVVVSRNAAGVRLGRFYLRWGEESLARLIDTVARFEADPAAAFRASRTRCCICRRRLTDAASCARGIGPECLKDAEGFVRLLERKMREGVAHG